MLERQGLSAAEVGRERRFSLLSQPQRHHYAPSMERSDASSNFILTLFWSVFSHPQLDAIALPNRLHTFTASTAVWLFVRDPTSLDEVEQMGKLDFLYPQKWT